MSTPHGSGESPIKQLLVSMSGVGGSEHDTDEPGANAVSIKAGHEPDRFEVKPILMVPAFVAIVLVVAYLLISGLFFNFARHESDPNANPQIAEQNKASINDRFARISSTDPKALPGKPDTAVGQPRLEYLKQTADDGPWDDPAFARSKRPIEAAGATYEIRPEDLRPENYLDPVSHKKILAEYGWVGNDHKTARMPIGDGMKWVIDGKKLPVSKTPIKVSPTSDDRAKPSNAGRGGPSQPAPAAPKHE